MNVVYFYRDQRFTWNWEKALSNIAKHDVHSEQACQVFFDPLAQILDASASSEQREAAIGTTTERTILYVVHVHRNEEEIRIISAREATSTERKNYEDNE